MWVNIIYTIVVNACVIIVNMRTLKLLDCQSFSFKNIIKNLHLYQLVKYTQMQPNVC